MIEALKQALEALEKSLPRLAPYGEQDWLDSKAAITSLRQAIRERALYEVQRLGQEIEQEPVAWMHIMDNTEGIKANGAGIVSITQKRKHPFGKAGIDFSKSYPVTSTPLYTHPPQRTEQEPVDYEKLAALGWQAIECGICGGGAMGYPQRTWAGLTKDEVDSWNLPDHPTVFEFAQFIESKLKEKNI